MATLQQLLLEQQAENRCLQAELVTINRNTEQHFEAMQQTACGTTAFVQDLAQTESQVEVLQTELWNIRAQALEDSNQLATLNQRWLKQRAETEPLQSLEVPSNLQQSAVRCKAAPLQAAQDAVGSLEQQEAAKDVELKQLKNSTTDNLRKVTDLEARVEQVIANSK